jgi:hypothetical protein
LKVRFYQKLEAGKSEPSLTTVLKVIEGIGVSLEKFLNIPPAPADAPDPVYEELIHTKSLVDVPAASVHMLDLFLEAPPDVRAAVLALLAIDERIAEPYLPGFAERQKRFLKKAP